MTATYGAEVRRPAVSARTWSPAPSGRHSHGDPTGRRGSSRLEPLPLQEADGARQSTGLTIEKSERGGSRVGERQQARSRSQHLVLGAGQGRVHLWVRVETLPLPGELGRHETDGRQL